MSAIAIHTLRPRETFLINPNPDKGAPVPLAGLEVAFGEDDFVGLRMVAYRKIGFVISPAAAIQLAQLILVKVQFQDGTFYLADQHQLHAPGDEAAPEEVKEAPGRDEAPVDPGV